MGALRYFIRPEERHSTAERKNGEKVCLEKPVFTMNVQDKRMLYVIKEE